jgi:hypothetical protein
VEVKEIMQNGVRSRALSCWLLATVCILAAAVSAGAVPALVRTNAGEVFQGGLSGFAPTLRLADPFSRVGPAAQYDIPLSSILQISVDFPRIVVETDDRVYIGPYSAFSGIADQLRMDERGVTTEILTTTLSAVALNEQPFRPLPREWLGRGWLGPGVFVLEKTSAAAEPAPTLARTIASVAESGDEDIVWGALTPTETPAEEPAGLPWWVGLIAVGLIVALVVFSSSSSGS